MVSRFLGFLKLFLGNYSLQAPPTDLENKGNIVIPDVYGKRYLLNQVVKGKAGEGAESRENRGLTPPPPPTLPHQLSGVPRLSTVNQES